MPSRVYQDTDPVVFSKLIVNTRLSPSAALGEETVNAGAGGLVVVVVGAVVVVVVGAVVVVGIGTQSGGSGFNG